jgi:hypothetical protein
MAAKLPTQDEAETLALRAVAFLAERPQEFLRFADLCGVSVEQIRGRLDDPALLGAVLDYVLFSDAMVRDFAAAAQVDPEAPRLARARLPGPPAPE